MFFDDLSGDFASNDSGKSTHQFTPVKFKTKVTPKSKEVAKKGIFPVTLPILY